MSSEVRDVALLQLGIVPFIALDPCIHKTSLLYFKNCECAALLKNDRSWQREVDYAIA